LSPDKFGYANRLRLIVRAFYTNSSRTKTGILVWINTAAQEVRNKSKKHEKVECLVLELFIIQASKHQTPKVI
jgi:hypothetical protein